MTAPTSPSMTRGEHSSRLSDAEIRSIVKIVDSGEVNDPDNCTTWGSDELFRTIAHLYKRKRLTPSPAQPTAGDVGRIAERVRERFLNASAHKDQWLEILEDAEALANYVLQRTIPTSDALAIAKEFCEWAYSDHSLDWSDAVENKLAALITRERAEAKGREDVARKAERERCAVIADGYATDGLVGERVGARAVAQAIRAQGDEKP